MAVNKTPNYDLNKPDYTEIADIPGHFNANFDTIDTAMKSNADAAVAAEVNAKSYASGLIGTLSNLLTTAKNNIVVAVNEIFGKVEDVGDALDSHLAENAQKHITESGSNENGEYVKFDDGTMICTHKLLINTDIATSSGALYRSNSLTWIFPASFIDNLIGMSGFVGSAITNCFLGGNVVNSYNVGFYILRPISTNVSDLYINLIAIGRWK